MRTSLLLSLVIVSCFVQGSYGFIAPSPPALVGVSHATVKAHSHRLSLAKWKDFLGKPKLDRERKEFSAEKKAWEETKKHTHDGVGSQTSMSDAHAPNREPKSYRFKFSSFVEVVGRVVTPTVTATEAFKAGPRYSLDSTGRIATRIGSQGWAVLGGPEIKLGVTTTIHLMKSCMNHIMIGISPIDSNRKHAGSPRSVYHVLYCMTGKIHSGPLCCPGNEYLERDIRESSTVGVLLGDDGDLFFSIDGVWQARALSVPPERDYELVVAMLDPGDQIKLL